MRLAAINDISLPISAIRPYNTSTARFFIRTSDTGSVTTTGLVLDLSRALHQGSTGGKPLDATVHPRRSGPPPWRSVAVAIPLEMTFHTSGVNTYVEITHKHRSAASGAGSTWETLKTDTKRFKMGTDTDATHFNGVVSGCSLQAVKKFYKANVRFFWRKASDTSAKDTTTNQQLIAQSALYMLSGDAMPESAVPKTV